MALSAEQSMALYGTPAYTGWGEVEAAADARARGITAEAGEVIPTFDFDFAGAAEQAYGELGQYYDRILKESRGDLDLALSRLTEDYERGKRIRAEDLAFAQQGLTRSRAERERQLQNAQLRKGISRTSLYDPSGGRGIADVEQTRFIEEPFARRFDRLATLDRRGGEEADIARTRTTQDLERGQERLESEQERQRRLEAAQLANLRGQRAYQKFSSQLI